MRNFRKLDIWKKGIEMVKDIYQITGVFPDSERFGLISQMQRASVSLPSNIAEGCSRNSDIEYKRFLEIAVGSAFELETQLTIAYELKFIEKSSYQHLLNDLNVLQKQINKLISVIANSREPKANSHKTK